MEPIRKILLVHTGGVGDLIMARPAIQLIRMKYPSAQLDFLGTPTPLKLLKQDSWIQRLIPFPSDNKNVLSSFKVMWILVRLRFRKYDYLYLLQPVLDRPSHHRLHFLVNSIAARTSMGRRSRFGSDFLDESVAESSGLHEVERMLSIFTNGNIEDVFTGTYLLPATFGESRHSIKSVNKPFVILSPGGAKSYRRWPIENFLELSYRFIGLGLNVIFVGGIHEKNIMSGKEVHLPEGALNLIGETNLDDLCSLILKSQIVVANDSGPIHLANALNVPVVGIFGSGDVTRTRPYLDEKALVVDSPPMECKPCYSQTCETLSCMDTISVDMVWSAVLDLL